MVKVLMGVGWMDGVDMLDGLREGISVVYLIRIKMGWEWE
jgi:hypothetical protein